MRRPSFIAGGLLVAVAVTVGVVLYARTAPGGQATADFPPLPPRVEKPLPQAADPEAERAAAVEEAQAAIAEAEAKLGQVQAAVAARPAPAAPADDEDGEVAEDKVAERVNKDLRQAGFRLAVAKGRLEGGDARGGLDNAEQALELLERADKTLAQAEKD